ncbi:hypothetical protein MLD38_021282 [Melastoma candidum]|uniref:Uncharacterized protein n=1 Tax=Melastoma candidum TaxID=119954 RepID=A0ACB9QJ08_9MYRT|nr:hypothetical protein MLD38_021282 [Melastoma candidum]
MLTEWRKEQSLMRSLRRSITSSSSSSTPSPQAKSSSTLSSPSTNSTLSSSSSSSSSSWIHLRSVLLVVASPSLSTSSSLGSPNHSRGNLKSPWSRRRRKHALLPKQWRSLFGPDGKLSDGGIKFLKKVRSGGVDPSIRGEVWPLLLGIYDMNSSKDERDTVRSQNSREYEDLRKECQRLLKLKAKALEPEDDGGGNNIEGSTDFSPVLDSIAEEDDESSRISCSSEKDALSSNYLDAQEVYQVPESLSLILAVGNEEKSKVPVLQCLDRIPAATMESHGGPELHPSAKITGVNLQKSRDLEYQREDTVVECQADKPQPHNFQALVAITLINSRENGDQGCQKKGMWMEGLGEKCEHEAATASVTAGGNHLQKNGKQDCQREDAVADGHAKKPYHLQKNGKQDCQRGDAVADGHAKKTDHLQKNGKQDCQREDAVADEHAKKPDHLQKNGKQDCHREDAVADGYAKKHDHLQKNGKQDCQRKDAVADGHAKKPEHKVLRHSAPISREILLKNGDMDCQKKGTPVEEDVEKSGLTSEGVIADESDSTDSDSSDELENAQPSDIIKDADLTELAEEILSNSEIGDKIEAHGEEDFAMWQKIIRLDALRAHDDWVVFSPSQANVTEESARQFANSVGLKNYDHLEPCQIFHAARLVAILEAYALYDPEIGYCQGMSDLLSPIISVMEEDDEAFWCFVGFMKKARHNFRLDEVGIRRQLNIVSKIIKCKDSHLYSHLEKLQAEDCFFVYRMVVVLFRRELNFEQTLCLWEVMWADQAAIRTGIAKSAWGRMRLRAPPTDDLLLYAIAACVLQRRKLIIEKYSSMEEIMRECNSMAGQLDVWRLLDDAHDLVVTLHEKIQ